VPNNCVGSDRIDHSSHASSVGNLVSYLVSNLLSSGYASRMGEKAKAATMNHSNRHKIEGTLVIIITCAHNMAETLSSISLDFQKAVQIWNVMYTDDMLYLDDLQQQAIDKVAAISIHGYPATSVVADQGQENSMKIITGQTLGSCFVGLIHVNQNTVSAKVSKSYGFDFPIDSSIINENEINSFALKNSCMRHKTCSSYVNKLNSVLTSESILSYCDIITLGFESNNYSDKNVSENCHSSLPEATTADAMIDSNHSNFKKYDSLTQRKYFMATLNEFIVKAGKGTDGGVPIQFMVKPITKHMIIEQYLKTTSNCDNYSFQHAYLEKENKQKPSKWRKSQNIMLSLKGTMQRKRS